MKQMNLKLKMFSTFYPQTDGKTKRVNQILEKYLRAHFNTPQYNWAEFFPLEKFSYNSYYHSSANLKPFNKTMGPISYWYQRQPLLQLYLGLSTTCCSSLRSTRLFRRNSPRMRQPTIPTRTASVDPSQSSPWDTMSI